jgi:hypothetical protein
VQVVSMEEGKNLYLISVEKAERKIFDVIDVDGRLVLKCRTEQHRQHLSTCYEHTNEIAGCVKLSEFLPNRGTVSC